MNKDDGTHRFCVDYKALNNVTIPNAYAVNLRDIKLDSQLTEEEKKQIMDLIQKYLKLFTGDVVFNRDNNGSHARRVFHRIQTLSSEVAKARLYPVSHALRKYEKESIEKMLADSLIEKSTFF